MIARQIATLAAAFLSAIAALATEPPEIPERFRDAAAVVLNDSRTWTVVPPKYANLIVSERILVQDPRRFDDSDRAIFYDKEHSNLESFSARTVQPTGEIIAVPSELQIDTVVIGGAGIELRALQFTFLSVIPGSILELSYRIQERDPASARVWEPQRTIPVLESRFDVDVRQPTYVQQLGIESYVRGAEKEACDIEKSKQGARASRLAIVCRNLPAFQPEPQAPPEADLKLQFDVMWGDGQVQQYWWSMQSRIWVGRIESFIQERAACERLAAEVTADARDDKDKLDRIYDWIRQNIGVDDEYALSGSSVFRPGGVDQLLEDRRGRSPEITALALALLRESNLRAWPILVADRSYGRFSYEALDPLQHLMLEVEIEGSPTLLDPSCRYCEPGITDWRYAAPSGAAGILLDTGSRGGMPIRLSVLPARHNVETRTEQVRIVADGTVRVEGKVSWSGQFAIDRRRRWESLTETARREDFLGSMSGTLEDPSVKFSDPRDVLQLLTAEYSYGTGASATEDGRLLIRPIDVFSGQLDFPIQERRTQPLWLPFPFAVGARILFELPPGYVVTLPDEPIRIDGPGMEFVADWKHEHDGLVFTGRMNVDWVEIEPARYTEVREFVRRLRHRLRGGLVAERDAS